MELITESKQELPGWLESMASDFRIGSGRRSNGSKGGYVFLDILLKSSLNLNTFFISVVVLVVLVLVQEIIVLRAACHHHVEVQDHHAETMEEVIASIGVLYY